MAIFFTTMVMYFGPVISPGNVPKLSEDLIPYLFAAMVLSGTLLVLWTLSAVWGGIRQVIKDSAKGVSSWCPLSESETAILFLMAQNPTISLNLDHIDYSRAPGTKLEFHQLTKALERKGLVSINSYNDDLVSLTERGREKALKIQKQVKNGTPA